VIGSSPRLGLALVVAGSVALTAVAVVQAVELAQELRHQRTERAV
jgi:hypothetical protein